MDELPEGSILFDTKFNCGFIDFLTQAALVKLVVPSRKVKQVSMLPLKRLLHTVKVNRPTKN